MTVETMQETATGAGVEFDASEEVARALELTNGSVVDITPRLRRDYDTRGSRLRSGALVIDCLVEHDDGSTTHPRVEIDDQRRPMSELAITFLGALADRAANRGDYIYRTVCT